MKTLEWTLNWCILQSMFDRRDFISNPETLKRRLMVVGLAMLLLSPFLVIFMLVYLFLRHAEQFYNHPSTASYRRWSNLSRWIFREFSEELCLWWFNIHIICQRDGGRGKEKTDGPIFKIMVIAIMVHLIYHTSLAWRSSRGKMEKSFLRSSALQRDDIVWNRYMRV
ncbi:autophagy-related protein 9-like isoform X2 [Euphorbia lathyris]|uniref:autophagy-related protein 9-like isoform X2 n=1 Tax=Euphorbia lathyris TaxID=212925 RepID=UPI003313155B